MIETLSKCGPLLQFIHLPGESPAFTADTTIETSFIGNNKKIEENDWLIVERLWQT